MDPIISNIYRDSTRYECRMTAEGNHGNDALHRRARQPGRVGGWKLETRATRRHKAIREVAAKPNADKSDRSGFANRSDPHGIQRPTPAAQQSAPRSGAPS